MSSLAEGDGVVASALEIVAIEEAAGVSPESFSAAEQAYAASKSDPVRRLAARLAAKRAAAHLLAVDPAEVEVLPARGGPPRLRLSPRAERNLAELGARRTLLSLTHGRTHAAAAVLLLR
ncbi:MAG TPA: holo-ACP synthase [Vicinamibacteria bacterium]|nr:holo-ACP synthase [Vicinamibacteria bacterium]